MTYTWDPKKNRRNVALHGIAFEDAAKIFEGPTVERVDNRFDYGEVRVYAIGLVNGFEITVIYTDVSKTQRRIISAWRAERHERKRTGATLVKPSRAKPVTDWKRVSSISDRSIRRAIENDPGARATTEDFWKKAEIVLPQNKQTITIRLDTDLLKWLRRQRGYQTRINAVLRTYMEANLPG